MYKVLIVDDEQSVRYSFKKLLGTSSYELHEASNAEAAVATFHRVIPHLVILDIEMPGKDGIQVLKELKEISPSTPVIIITAYGSGDRVIKAMKYGAYEYVEKPFDIPRLKATINEALEVAQISNEPSAEPRMISKEKTKPNEDAIVGESSAIKEVFKLIGRVAASDASILIVGESGTGKELVAKAIHRYSDRLTKPFIAINCAAIPEALLESELFGYERGAFTGAERQKLGKFEEANKGTLFLDEVGDMGLSLQSKLLRVLQEGTIERLGSSKSIKVDVRIVAATNRHLENDIVRKSFREDLYYRLKVVTVTLPPLRMRREDIPLLAQHFMQKHSKSNRTGSLTLPPEALEKMSEYSWPGNIRELENVVKRAVILTKGNVIIPELLFEGIEKPSTNNPIGQDRLSNYLSDGISANEGIIYKLVVDEIERDLIKWALEKTKWNQAQAAKILGISRVMIHERMQKYQLKQ